MCVKVCMCVLVYVAILACVSLHRSLLTLHRSLLTLHRSLLTLHMWRCLHAFRLSFFSFQNQSGGDKCSLVSKRPM